MVTKWPYCVSNQSEVLVACGHSGREAELTMRAGGWTFVAMAMALGTAAQADEPTATAGLRAASLTTSPYRLKPAVAPVDPKFRLDDPRAIVRSGYGGSMVDLFPFEGGKFHVSGGGKLFGRPGRARNAAPESLRTLPAFHGGPRTSRRFSPAMLVGYGRTVDQGLTFGVDAGLMMGRIGAMPDRFGRLNRRRLDTVDGKGRRSGLNQIGRVTALYRF